MFGSNLYQLASKLSNTKRNSLNFLHTADFELISEHEIQELLQTLMINHEVRVSVINHGMVLYRGIKYSEKPKYFSEIIYPPKSLAKQNRASSNGEPMFYCTTLKKSIFYELFLKKGDRLIITTWFLKKQALFANIGYYPANLEKMGTSRVLPFHDKSNNNAPTENDIIANYLSSAFCKVVLPGQESYYKLTNAIAKTFLGKGVQTRKDDNRYNTTIENPELIEDVYNDEQMFPGIQYPTIHNNGIEDNYAIQPEAINDGLLELEKIEYVEFLGLNETNYQYRLLDIAFEVKDSRIIWKELTKSWCLSDNQDSIVFVEDNGEVEAYTSEGDIYNCE